jgi:cytochrome c oxidase subunit II
MVGRMSGSCSSMRSWRSAVAAAGAVLIALAIIACAKNPTAPAVLSPEAERGLEIARAKGCLACHSTDGRPSMASSWKGLLGKTRPLSDGTSVIADESYLRRSILEPQAQRVEGATTVMPRVVLTDDQVNAIMTYLASL